MVSQHTAVTTALARRAWRTMEPYHALIYFVPEARSAFKELGLKGYWMGYFASRAAPLGAVSASVVTALFFNFQDGMVRRAIPDAWQFSTLEKVLQTRYRSADAALQRLLGDQITSPEVAEAATIARQAIEGCALHGRALFAAYTDLSWPQQPHMVLWHAATLLREYRGDGHVAALLAEGIDGCQAHILQAAAGRAPRETIQPSRGWSDDEWATATLRLQQRGLLTENGQFTDQGQKLHQHIEDRTDLLASPAWQHLGEARTEHLLSLVAPLSKTIIAQGGVPVPNPMGLQ